MPLKNLDNVFKGLSLQPTLDTDFFDALENMEYDRQKRLITRRGSAPFGAQIPDAAVTVDLLDATTGWSAAEDANTVAVGAALRGTASISFAVTPTGALAASVVKSTLAANLTTAKGAVGFFLKVPVGFNTKLTDVRFRLGSDASNYYEWTLPALTEATTQYVYLLFSAAATTGTPVDASVAYARLRLTYVSGYAAQAGILFDDVRAFSATASKPVTSLFSFQRDDTLATYLLAASGTALWSYEPLANAWSLAATGLTEFETAQPTHRTRWSFAVYKNVVYMGNGVDPYCSWNGILFTTYGAQPKCRFLKYMGDRVFAGGDDANPSTLYWTASLPADAATVNTNSLVVGGDEQGKIQALKDIGQTILAGKTRKVYGINVTTPSSQALDTRTGILSHRSVQPVGNALVYFNEENGFDQLANRTALSGASALQSDALGTEVKALLNNVDSGSYQSIASLYNVDRSNYYAAYPSQGGDVPDKLLVFSSQFGAWSRWTLGTTIYDLCEYWYKDGTYRNLFASAQFGQVFEFNVGYLDNGQPIPARLTTKGREFGQPAVLKHFEYVDLIGYKSRGGKVTCSVILDGLTVASSTLTDAQANVNDPLISLGTQPISTMPLGGTSTPGDPSSVLDLYPYVIRIPVYASGFKFQVDMQNSDPSNVWTLQKVRVNVDSSQVELIGFANFG